MHEPCVSGFAHARGAESSCRPGRPTLFCRYIYLSIHNDDDDDDDDDDGDDDDDDETSTSIAGRECSCAIAARPAPFQP